MRISQKLSEPLQYKTCFLKKTSLNGDGFLLPKFIFLPKSVNYFDGDMKDANID
jgi:hypothetical protein